MSVGVAVLKGGLRLSRSKTGRGLLLLMIILFLLMLSLPMFFLLLFVDQESSLNTGITGAGATAAYVVSEEINYQEVAPEFIVDWLKRRNSALGTMEFAQACVAAGKRYNVNPLLLVAITGQEQSFCPAGSPAAMLKNPWNTFGSWQNTNHSVEQSAMYAAECIARLSRNRPEGFHPIAWLNSRDNAGGMYATDPNWWNGVSSFFRQIRSDHGDQMPLIAGRYFFPIQVPYTISSPFGASRDTGPHSGVDLACPMGTPIYSVSAGVVTGLVKGDPVGGNEVWIAGADGRTYAYWHCSHFGNVRVGQTVEAGDLIAYVGSTGRSTGPHLHLGVKEKGKWVDGLRLFHDSAGRFR